jgi:hypothetical protein
MKQPQNTERNNSDLGAVIGCFYHVNIIGTGTLLLKFGFHKHDVYEKEPCFLTDEGYKVNKSDYDSFVLAF